MTARPAAAGHPSPGWPEVARRVHAAAARRPVPSATPSHLQPPVASMPDETFARSFPANDQIWLLSWLSRAEPGLVALAVAALEDYHAAARAQQKAASKRREKARRRRRRAGL